MICLVIEPDGTAYDIDLPADPAGHADALAVLTGAAAAVRVSIDRDLDLWTGTGPSRRALRPANAVASALAADLSGEPWQTFYGTVVICGLELGEAGQEHVAGLTGDRLVALHRRIGRATALSEPPQP